MAKLDLRKIKTIKAVGGTTTMYTPMYTVIGHQHMAYDPSTFGNDPVFVEDIAQVIDDGNGLISPSGQHIDFDQKIHGYSLRSYVYWPVEDGEKSKDENFFKDKNFRGYDCVPMVSAQYTGTEWKCKYEMDEDGETLVRSWKLGFNILPTEDDIWHYFPYFLNVPNSMLESVMGDNYQDPEGICTNAPSREYITLRLSPQAKTMPAIDSFQSQNYRKLARKIVNCSTKSHRLNITDAKYTFGFEVIGSDVKGYDPQISGEDPNMISGHFGGGTGVLQIDGIKFKDRKPTVMANSDIWKEIFPTAESAQGTQGEPEQWGEGKIYLSDVLTFGIDVPLDTTTPLTPSNDKCTLDLGKTSLIDVIQNNPTYYLWCADGFEDVVEECAVAGIALDNYEEFRDPTARVYVLRLKPTKVVEDSGKKGGIVPTIVMVSFLKMMMGEDSTRPFSTRGLKKGDGGENDLNESLKDLYKYCDEYYKVGIPQLGMVSAGLNMGLVMNKEKNRVTQYTQTYKAIGNWNTPYDASNFGQDRVASNMSDWFSGTSMDLDNVAFPDYSHSINDRSDFQVAAWDGMSMNAFANFIIGEADVRFSSVDELSLNREVMDSANSYSNQDMTVDDQNSILSALPEYVITTAELMGSFRYVDPYNLVPKNHGDWRIYNNPSAGTYWLGTYSGEDDPNYLSLPDYLIVPGMNADGSNPYEQWINIQDAAIMTDLDSRDGDISACNYIAKKTLEHQAYDSYIVVYKLFACDDPKATASYYTYIVNENTKIGIIGTPRRSGGGLTITEVMPQAIHCVHGRGLAIDNRYTYEDLKGQPVILRLTIHCKEGEQDVDLVSQLDYRAWAGPCDPGFLVDLNGDPISQVAKDTVFYVADPASPYYGSYFQQIAQSEPIADSESNEGMWKLLKYLETQEETDSIKMTLMLGLDGDAKYEYVGSANSTPTEYDLTPKFTELTQGLPWLWRNSEPFHFHNTGMNAVVVSYNGPVHQSQDFPSSRYTWANILWDNARNEVTEVTISDYATDSVGCPICGDVLIPAGYSLYIFRIDDNTERLVDDTNVWVAPDVAAVQEHNSAVQSVIDEIDAQLNGDGDSGTSPKGLQKGGVMVDKSDKSDKTTFKDYTEAGYQFGQIGSVHLMDTNDMSLHSMSDYWDQGVAYFGVSPFTFKYTTGMPVNDGSIEVGGCLNSLYMPCVESGYDYQVDSTGLESARWFAHHIFTSTAKHSWNNQTSKFCAQMLFANEGWLGGAAGLEFPISATPFQYWGMFRNAVNLQVAPVELPALTIWPFVYGFMFSGTSINSTPMIYAKTSKGISNTYIPIEIIGSGTTKKVDSVNWEIDAGRGGTKYDFKEDGSNKPFRELNDYDNTIGLPTTCHKILLKSTDYWGLGELSDGKDENYEANSVKWFNKDHSGIPFFFPRMDNPSMFSGDLILRSSIDVNYMDDIGSDMLGDLALSMSFKAYISDPNVLDDFKSGHYYTPKYDIIGSDTTAYNPMVFGLDRLMLDNRLLPGLEPLEAIRFKLFGEGMKDKYDWKIGILMPETQNKFTRTETDTLQGYILDEDGWLGRFGVSTPLVIQNLKYGQTFDMGDLNLATDQPEELVGKLPEYLLVPGDMMLDIMKSDVAGDSFSDRAHLVNATNTWYICRLGLNEISFNSLSKYIVTDTAKNPLPTGSRCTKPILVMLDAYTFMNPEVFGDDKEDYSTYVPKFSVRNLDCGQYRY